MLLKKCNCFLFTLLICIWGAKTFAQPGDNFIVDIQEIYIPFTLSHFGTKHGLPQNQILDIVQKKNGRFILATVNGIVEFNGIGRKKYDRINQNRKNHESKGTQLVKSKIEIVKLEYNLKIDFKFEDIDNEKGTKVILKIPLYD
jgi:hypothetical protein